MNEVPTTTSNSTLHKGLDIGMYFVIQIYLIYIYTHTQATSMHCLLLFIKIASIK